MIFVFGSNLAGRHGKGAALFALQNHGAIYGQGVGRQGNSYAIPTKDAELKSLPLDAIRKYVNQFLAYAAANDAIQFEVSRVGCGLAGYKDHDISPMFRKSPVHVHLPDGWSKE